MFLQASVCQQGGGVCLSAWWDTPPRSRHPLGVDTPGADTLPRADTPRADTPRNRHPLGADTQPGADPLLWEKTPPGADPPLPPGADPPKRWPLLRTVRILLVCILVEIMLIHDSLYMYLSVQWDYIQGKVCSKQRIDLMMLLAFWNLLIACHFERTDLPHVAVQFWGIKQMRVLPHTDLLAWSLKVILLFLRSNLRNKIPSFMLMSSWDIMSSSNHDRHLLRQLFFHNRNTHIWLKSSLKLFLLL